MTALPRQLLAEAVGTLMLLTAGPTREALDPVRYISNHSSGKMGFAPAREAAAAGARVTLIAGPVHLPTPPRVTRLDVVSAADMLAAAMQHADACDIFIATAAVVDYRPSEVARRKIKKDAATMTLPLTRNPDILASVAALENAPFTVGFAAETDDLEGYARGKLMAKSLNMIAANSVGGLDSAFDADDNALQVYWPGGEASIARNNKNTVARDLLELIAQRYKD